jgi:acyl carrier protein
MTTMDILNEVFRRVFDDEGLVVTPETTANDVDGWDSLSHVNLVTALEARFKIRFSAKELLTQKNVGDLRAGIDAKLPKPGA